MGSTQLTNDTRLTRAGAARTTGKPDQASSGRGRYAHNREARPGEQLERALRAQQGGQSRRAAGEGRYAHTNSNSNSSSSGWKGSDDRVREGSVAGGWTCSITFSSALTSLSLCVKVYDRSLDCLRDPAADDRLSTEVWRK